MKIFIGVGCEDYEEFVKLFHLVFFIDRSVSALTMTTIQDIWNVCSIWLTRTTLKLRMGGSLCFRKLMFQFIIMTNFMFRNDNIVCILLILKLHKKSFGCAKIYLKHLKIILSLIGKDLFFKLNNSIINIGFFI